METLSIKQKADELVNRFYNTQCEVLNKEFPPMEDVEYNIAVRSAIVCVDELISTLSVEPPRPSNIYQSNKYWIQVKAFLNTIKETE